MQKQGRSVMDRPCLFFIAEGVFLSGNEGTN